MPGERLTCLWQVVHAQGLKHDSGEMPRDSLKQVILKLSDLDTVHYASDTFADAFKDSKRATYDEAKKYVINHLREKDTPIQLFCDGIEQKCWELCKPFYSSTLKEAELRKLWMMSNRLIREGSYPPIIDPIEGQWLLDNMCSQLGPLRKSSSGIGKPGGNTFQDLIVSIEETFLRDTSNEKMKTSIDKLFEVFVTEVLRCGWVHKRSKRRANWSTWARKWCIVTPGKVVFSTSERKVEMGLKQMKSKDEIFLNKRATVSCLSDYNGIINRLKGRFLVSDQPTLDLEISVGSLNDRSSWINAMEESIQCCADGMTPIQKLLHERRFNQMTKESSEKTKESSEKAKETAEKEKTILNELSKKSSSTKPNDTSQVETTVDKLDRAENVTQCNSEKLKAVFMQIDKNGNGLVDKEEFATFLSTLGLQLSEKEVNMVFHSVDVDRNGAITFEEFGQYFSNHIMDESSSQECVNALRKAFLQADRDGSGTVSFREFIEYTWEKKRSLRMSMVMNAFSKVSKDDSDEMTFADFQNTITNGTSDVLIPIIEENDEDDKENEDDKTDLFKKQMKQVYSDVEAEDLACFIRKRWNKFATFRRKGDTGSVVMQGGHGMVADLLPGEYNLIDLACFSDLPPLVPKHTIVKGFKWISSHITGKSGKLIFPEDFDGNVALDIATNELLRYYECSFADSQQEKVSLLYRHGIQDFTYENGYLDSYVKTSNGGAGLERHEFSHLDCPLSADSGIFVLAKITEDGNELHITGFKIPERHTLYIPGGTIHCNDYLKGTWRTMLSDETDIDHVHLTRTKASDLDYFQFHFN